MGYTIPLKFIRVSEKMSVCATRILLIVDAACSQGRAILREEKESKTLLRADPSRSAKSVVILDNGTVISSPYTIARLLTNVNTAGIRDRRKRLPLSVALEVYPDETLVDGTQETYDIEAVGENAEVEDDELEEDAEEDEDIAQDAQTVAWDGGTR